MHDALLEADWSRGRLLYTPLTRKGASYTAASARTELVHGEPLNITDVEVGPDGLVYFTTGGRTTEGGVFRVTYSGAEAGDRQADAAARRGAPAAAALELGPRRGRQGEGRSRRRLGERPRGAGPRSRGPRRGSRPGGLRAAAARPGAAGARCSPT